MGIRIKAYYLLAFLLVLIICLVSYSMCESFMNDKAKSDSILHKGGIKVNWRKLLGHDQVLDYDYTGPNPKHDPRKGKSKGP